MNLKLKKISKQPLKLKFKTSPFYFAFSQLLEYGYINISKS